ncbi:hypothetical protein QBC37DRAFT_449498 [Rhypophila decipiens]|uniref:Uncharacterized protein n=1 Tax=Rhypophila decipiens TaxID=261697 RepID=A0AAN6Y026_9PEZI|nr:hypothetical protein QBC37DRAFT_449498 [Rhypophila decipiens]
MPYEGGNRGVDPFPPKLYNVQLLRKWILSLISALMRHFCFFLTSRARLATTTQHVLDVKQAFSKEHTAQPLNHRPKDDCNHRKACSAQWNAWAQFHPIMYGPGPSIHFYSDKFQLLLLVVLTPYPDVYIQGFVGSAVGMVSVQLRIYAPVLAVWLSRRIPFFETVDHSLSCTAYDAVQYLTIAAPIAFMSYLPTRLTDSFEKPVTAAGRSPMDGHGHGIRNALGGLTVDRSLKQHLQADSFADLPARSTRMAIVLENTTVAFVAGRSAGLGVCSIGGPMHHLGRACGIGDALLAAGGVIHGFVLSITVLVTGKLVLEKMGLWFRDDRDVHFPHYLTATRLKVKICVNAVIKTEVGEFLDLEKYFPVAHLDSPRGIFIRQKGVV